jgi:hypothetical protein
MKARAAVFFALAISFVLASFSAVAAASVPEAPGYAPKLMIYLAKGEADSCGRGCDRWIAIEGKVDAEAAERVRRFLRGVKETNRPIYFHSPGGDVRQAFAIGRLLRARKAVGRVGRTVVAACSAGSQTDDACLKIKTSGGEVQAELATRNAMCNSACGYLFLGATTREVAPDAVLGVHNSKLFVQFRGHPSAGLRAEFLARQHERDDRERSSYVQAMGISHELVALIQTVAFESVHVLTRPEIYRFRIDTRAFAETTWELQPGARAFVRKTAVAKKDDGSFRTMEWRLFCANKDRVPLMFLREFDPGGAGTNSVALISGSEKPPLFGAFPARVGGYELWSAFMAADAVRKLFALPHLEVGESTLLPDGKATQAMFEIETSGLASAWTQLSATCVAPPSSAYPIIGVPATPNRPAL